jgi:hypothetical protein
MIKGINRGGSRGPRAPLNILNFFIRLCELEMLTLVLAILPNRFVF